MTTWGSRNAEDMFRVAVLLANFDAADLMTRINKRSRDRKTNERTVLACMQEMRDEQANAY